MSEMMEILDREYRKYVAERVSKKKQMIQHFLVFNIIQKLAELLQIYIKTMMLV